MARRNAERAPLLGGTVPSASRSGTYGATAAAGPPEAGDDRIQETQTSHDAQSTGAGPRKGGLARQIAPDLLRGLLMIFMALDHTSVSLSAYPHGTNGAAGEKSAREITIWASNLAYALRTLTHLCAPGFAMLLGMGIAFFMASRAGQGWSTGKLLTHFVKRMVAIIIVNEVAFLFVIIPMRVWLFNAVLWALGIDYFLVGVLAIGINLYLEPAIERLWLSVLASSSSTHEPDADDAPNIGPVQKSSATPARSAAFNTVNALLFVASAVLLWSNIWLDGSKGDCDIHHKQQMHSLVAGPSFPDSGNCKAGLGAIYEFFFHSMSCLNLGVFSGFPPIPWLSFSLFGLIYGRLLLADQTRRKQQQLLTNGNATTPSASTSVSMIALEASLAVFFALLFVATRVLQFGNLSTHCLREAPVSLFGSSGTALKQAGNPYLVSPKAFFFIVKYPPSPAFAFFTLSACFALLALFALLTTPSVAPNTVSTALRSEYNPLLIFGRQPLFYYAVHMLLIKGFSIVAQYIPGLMHDLPKAPWGKGPKDDPQRGIGLGPVYFAIWATLLVLLYPVCFRYGRFKSKQSSDSLWRFL